MAGSRTKNALRNMLFGFFNKIIILLFPFIIRTIMIKSLGSEYLGLNSLFTSILQVLNLAELGFSSAIVYSMYKPIAENNTKKICALMNLYKKIYRIIGTIIFLSGLILLPFLKYLIKGSYPSDINIYLLYLIYLFNTTITYYLFAYKSALLTAHQRSDITSGIQSITSIVQYLLQIFILAILKNYYFFITIQIFTTILNNIWIALYTNKKYPNYLCDGEITKEEKNDIKKRVAGLVVQRICGTTRNSLDSIFISAFLGLNIVAIYSNYYSIMNSIIGIMSIITTAIVAGIGNSIVTESEEKNYNDMNKFNFIYMWISGWCTICLACLFQPFMKLWMGEKYMFSYPMVILFCVYFYSLKMGDIRAAYSDAKGLWYENRYRAIAETVANIFLNLLLVHFLGIYGIILGTLISLLIINFGYGSQILFKHYFVNQKMSEYFLYHLKYFITTLIICIITYFICSFIDTKLVYELIIKAIILVIVPNILYLVFYSKTKMFNESKELFINIIYKIKSKIRK